MEGWEGWEWLGSVVSTDCPVFTCHLHPPPSVPGVGATLVCLMRGKAWILVTGTARTRSYFVTCLHFSLKIRNIFKLSESLGTRAKTTGRWQERKSRGWQNTDEDTVGSCGSYVVMLSSIKLFSPEKSCSSFITRGELLGACLGFVLLINKFSPEEVETNWTDWFLHTPEVCKAFCPLIGLDSHNTVLSLVRAWHPS